MCGIIAGLSDKIGLGNIIWSGLSRLEYRGYDSFGIAFHIRNRLCSEIKQLGAPSDLVDRTWLDKDLSIAIGHTRWATHGGVTLENAHPHHWEIQGKPFCLVHNGVIENIQLWTDLLKKNYRDRLRSETDSEQIIALIAQYVDEELSIEAALLKVVLQIEGSFSIILANLEENRLWAIRRDLPLFFSSLSQSELLFTSDLAALPISHTKAYPLKNMELIIGEPFKIIRHSHNDEHIIENIVVKNNFHDVLDNRFSSYLESEIWQQAELIPFILSQPALKIPLGVEEIHFIACGSSFYAAQFSAQLFSFFNKIPSMAYVASEFRDNPPLITRPTLLIAFSQSGETADVLGALREQQFLYMKKIALCNRPGSIIEQFVDQVWPINAGPEYSVASTKVFTAQICQISRFIAFTDESNKRDLTTSIKVLLNNPAWELWARSFFQSSALILLARGMLLPIIHEGALKLRELTYKQIYAISSGELKHGSLALIDEFSTVLLCIPNDHTVQKLLVAAQEVHARGGKLFILIQAGVDMSGLPPGAQYQVIPNGSSLQTAIYFTLPFQLIAMHLAQKLGNCIDRPRNLAKSVTVE
jgi:glucosamine--fructose-6-phosphate aminotransferase (isomerizing)